MWCPGKNSQGESFVNKAGFTLIELLLVIAIIGILSGVVLSSLNSVKLKAKEAKVIAMMNDFKNQMEIVAVDYYGKYGDSGAKEFGVMRLNGAIELNGGPTVATHFPGPCGLAATEGILREVNKEVKKIIPPTGSHLSLCAVGPGNNSWMALTRLPSFSKTGGYPEGLLINYCVDSSGFSGKVDQANPIYFWNDLLPSDPYYVPAYTKASCRRLVDYH